MGDEVTFPSLPLAVTTLSKSNEAIRKRRTTTAMTPQKSITPCSLINDYFVAVTTQ